jgi:hypothetical protein
MSSPVADSPYPLLPSPGPYPPVTSPVLVHVRGWLTDGFADDVDVFCAVIGGDSSGLTMDHVLHHDHPLPPLLPWPSKRPTDN